MMSSLNVRRSREQRTGARPLIHTASGLACVGLAISTGACSSTSTVTRTTPGPTVTATVQVARTAPGPTVTATVQVARTTPGPTVTATVQVAAPTVTETETVTESAPPPAAGTKLGSWSGTGNQVTPAFNAPDSGDYIVAWTFSGNDTDGTPGGDNFIISATDSNATALSLPNVIATSGSGSAEATGASGTESFNVQATGNWTITATSAP